MKDVTVILPVINETFSLEKTVEIILMDNSDISEVIIVIANKTTQKSRIVIKDLMDRYPDLIKLHKQSLAYLGGAMREAFAMAKGKFTVMMSSDLETNPKTVKDLIKKIKAGNYDVVTATRWHKKRDFSGYSKLKFALNFCFQKFFSFLYGANLSDLTFGFRIFKTPLIQSIKWEELRHPFLFETIIKPLRLNAQIAEVETNWQVREEGESQNPFWVNFTYMRIGLKTRFMKTNQILNAR